MSQLGRRQVHREPKETIDRDPEIVKNPSPCPDSQPDPKVSSEENRSSRKKF